VRLWPSMRRRAKTINMIMVVYETKVAKTINMIMAVHETINRQDHKYDYGRL
jgi:hypothetical protein